MGRRHLLDGRVCRPAHFSAREEEPRRMRTYALPRGRLRRAVQSIEETGEGI